MYPEALAGRVDPLQLESMGAPEERWAPEAFVFYWIYVVLAAKIDRLKTCVIRCVVV
jgi:hypothetical protein